MKSSSAFDKSALADSQAAKADNGFARRLREAAAIKSLNQKQLAEKSGVPAARVNDYWNGPKEASPRNLFALADALDVSAEWLAFERGPRSKRLIDVADADWIAVPEYDLRAIDDHGKGEPISSTTMRRDWLYLMLGETAGLWIVKTLATGAIPGLPAGAPLVCKDHPAGMIPDDGRYYLFRVNGGIVTAKFSYRSQLSNQQGEQIVTPPDLDAGDNQHFIVGRVLGVLARPL